MLPDFERRRGTEAAPVTKTSYSHYWTFYDEVALRQLREWLPTTPSRILDLSRSAGRHAATMAAAGHNVVRLVDAIEHPVSGSTCEFELVQQVVAEPLTMGWVADGFLDGVVAESGALSQHLSAETALLSIHRALAPNGRVLICVDSLVLGLARLAEQSRWAELADVPSADVVLVPNEDGSITRCFWPEELEQDLIESGFDVEWIRPRTVLSQDAVERALSQDPSSLNSLVTTELALSREREGESIGVHLVASARRRG